MRQHSHSCQGGGRGLLGGACYGAEIQECFGWAVHEPPVRLQPRVLLGCSYLGFNGARGSAPKVSHSRWWTNYRCCCWGRGTQFLFIGAAQRTAWVSRHGSWLSPEQEIHETEVEAAVFFILTFALGVTCCHHFSGIIGYAGQHLLPVEGSCEAMTTGRQGSLGCCGG